MNTFALEIWDDESRYVTYYTVRQEDSDYTEMDKFMRKFADDDEHKEPLQTLLSLIFDVIGEEQGAHQAFFSRSENRASALPPSGVHLYQLTMLYPKFPLRLFCYRLSDNLVILFNGGRKTASSAQQSEDLNMPLIQANNFIKRITQAFDDGMLQIGQDGRTILDFQGSVEIYL